MIVGALLLTGCAPSPGWSNVAGVVVDEAGEPIAGCTVTASGLDGQSVDEVAAVTGESGQFEYPLQYAGRYRIAVTCDAGPTVSADAEAGADEIEIVVPSR